MMPQDSGSIRRYPASIALKDHTFEKIPTVVATGNRIWIYTILEKNDREVKPKTRTVDRPPLWDHLHHNTMHRLHQANCRIRRLCGIEVS